MSTEPIRSDPNDETDVADAASSRKTVVTRTRRVDVEEPKDTMFAVVMSLTAVFLVMALVVILGVRDLARGATQPSAESTAHKISDTFGKKPM